MLTDSVTFEAYFKHRCLCTLINRDLKSINDSDYETIPQIELNINPLTV